MSFELLTLGEITELERRIGRRYGPDGNPDSHFDPDADAKFAGLVSRFIQQEVFTAEEIIDAIERAWK